MRRYFCHVCGEECGDGYVWFGDTHVRNDCSMCRKKFCERCFVVCVQCEEECGESEPICDSCNLETKTYVRKKCGKHPRTLCEKHYFDQCKVCGKKLF